MSATERNVTDTAPKDEIPLGSRRSEAYRGLMRLPTAAMAVLLAVSAVPLASGATTSANKGQVGGPPTLPLGPADEGKKVTPAIVIARGHTYDGPVEIAAYGWKPPPDDPIGGTQCCVWIEYPRTRDIIFGTCSDALDQQGARGPIDIASEDQQFSPKLRRNTQIGGLVDPEVARVRVSFHRKGRRHRSHVRALVAKVDGDLQQKLKQPGPFGYFNVKVRGLVPFKTFRAQAFDANGNLIDTDKGY